MLWKSYAFIWKYLKLLLKRKMILKIIIIKLFWNLNVKFIKMESIKNFDFEKMILRLTGWKNIVERLINSWMQGDVLRLTFLESQWCNRSNILIWNRIWFLILVIQFHNKMKLIYFLNLKLKSRFWFWDAKIEKKICEGVQW